MTTRNVLLYCLFAIVSTAPVLIAIVLSPLLAAVSVALRRDTLPFGLQWFSTVDDTLDGGQHQHPKSYPPGATGWRLWWQRTCWIARNPAQGFQVYLLGFDASDMMLIANDMTGTPGEAPYCRYRVWRDPEGRRLWSYQRSISIGGRIYVKLWFGWTVKEEIERFSLKFVPFSLSSY